MAAGLPKPVDTSGNRPYDWLFLRDGVELLRVEVKGTTGAADSVTVTAGEVESARFAPTALFVQFNIETRQLDDGEWDADGGESRVIDLWMPLDDDLEPLTYRYRLPG